MRRILKVFLVLLGGFVLLTATVLATATQDEKVEAISELFDEINYFYLHENASDFMYNFYTYESIQHLLEVRNQVRQLKVQNWETDLDDATLTEIYQLLRSGITHLSPLMMRRGEAISFGEDLNFRSEAAVETQVLYRLPYGTPFEIIEDVAGGPVTDQDGVTSYLWFRIRHDDQSGFVHSRYVRAIPVSEYRVSLLADIARAELWIRSKIEGWHIDYSPPTIGELQEILNEVQVSQVENWQFDFSYSQLNDLLERLSIDNLNLITLSRYHLINSIIEVEREIESNMQGAGNAERADYTEASWQNMVDRLLEAQEFLIEDWQYLLTDEELEMIYDLLRSALNGLEEMPLPVEFSEEEDGVRENQSDFERRLRQLIFAFASLIGLIIIFKVVKFIRSFNG